VRAIVCTNVRTQIEKLLLAVYEAQEAYQELSDTHGAIAELVREHVTWEGSRCACDVSHVQCDNVVHEESDATRLWPNFYLVHFFGHPWRYALIVLRAI
jgi:hypothetical protein